MQFAVTAGNAFDGRDILSDRNLDGRYAGPNGRAVEVHGAGAALGDAAAELGAGQADSVTNDPQKRRRRVDVNIVRFAINVE